MGATPPEEAVGAPSTKRAFLWPNTDSTTGSTLARTSARSSMRKANAEPLGRDTKTVWPSSEMTVEVMSSDPCCGCVASRVSTTCFHLRWSSPASMGWAAAAGCRAGSGCGAGRGAGAGAGFGTGRGAGAAGAAVGASCGRGAGRGAGSIGRASGCGACVTAASLAAASLGTTVTGFLCSCSRDDSACFFSPSCQALSGADAATAARLTGLASLESRSTGAGAGAGAGAAADALRTPGSDSATTWRSSVATRSASASSVSSVCGRAILVSATSSTRRWLGATRISVDASESSPRARAMRSTEPNAWASRVIAGSSSSEACVVPDAAPIAATTYTSRSRAASARVNCSRSRPTSTRDSTWANSVGTSRFAMARLMRSSVEAETSPSTSRATSTLIWPPPETESCSSSEMASRMPPRA